jgi:hypothetical protein
MIPAGGSCLFATRVENSIRLLVIPAKAGIHLDSIHERRSQNGFRLSPE